MTKPTLSLARWADGGGANITAPPSGTRDTGFQGGTPALSGQVNALLNQHYLWASYLDAGQLEGNHEIDGDLEVTGATTLTGGIANTVTLSAGMTIGAGPTVVSGVISPTALASGNTDDWAPTGFSTANIVRVTTDAGHSTLRGLAGGSGSRKVYLVNIGLSAGNLVLAHNDIGSSDANRFFLPSAGSLTIRPYGCAEIWYDNDLSRWRVLSVNA